MTLLMKFINNKIFPIVSKLQYLLKYFLYQSINNEIIFYTIKCIFKVQTQYDIKLYSRPMMQTVLYSDDIWSCFFKSKETQFPIHL